MNFREQKPFQVKEKKKWSSAYKPTETINKLKLKKTLFSLLPVKDKTKSFSFADCFNLPQEQNT